MPTTDTFEVGVLEQAIANLAGPLFETPLPEALISYGLAKFLVDQIKQESATTEWRSQGIYLTGSTSEGIPGVLRNLQDEVFGDLYYDYEEGDTTTLWAVGVLSEEYAQVVRDHVKQWKRPLFRSGICLKDKISQVFLRSGYVPMWMCLPVLSATEDEVWIGIYGEFRDFGATHHEWHY